MYPSLAFGAGRVVNRSGIDGNRVAVDGNREHAPVSSAVLAMIRRSLMPDDENGPRLSGQWTAHEASGQCRNPSLIGGPCGRLRLRNRRQRPVQAGRQAGAHPTTTAKQIPSLPVPMHSFPGDRESRRCPPGAAHANNAWGPAIFRDAATKKTGQARA
jgi:hypothetical protein